jgi:hypothetical protein
VSTFDRELWETRGRIPHYITGSQRAEIEGVNHRVKSQLAFLAQLSGLNGDRYWPSDLLTISEMREVPRGAFGFPGSNPLTKTVGDRKFKIDSGRVLCGDNDLAPEYAQPVTLLTGFEYEFEGYVEIGSDPRSYYDAIDDRTRWIPSEGDVTGSVLDIGGCLFEIKPWEPDRPEDYYEDFLGLHGGKGNEMSLHWTLDATNYCGYRDSDLVMLPCIFDFDFTSIPPKINQTGLIPSDQRVYIPSIVTDRGDLAYHIEEEIGRMVIPPQDLTQDLEVFARYSSDLLDSDSGYSIDEGILELEGVRLDEDEGFFDFRLFTYWDVKFTSVFAPSVTNSAEPLRITKFKDVQVW